MAGEPVSMGFFKRAQSPFQLNFGCDDQIVSGAFCSIQRSFGTRNQ
jgi:hypothetical protein